MSVNVREIIEVKYNDTWELLENFYDGSHILTAADGVIPDDYIVYNGKERSTGEEKTIASDIHNLIFDDVYRDILLDGELNRGYLETDLGLPIDISKKAKEVYESIDNKSKASYFYLSDLYKVYCELYGEFSDIVDKVIDDEVNNDVNNKLDWIINKLQNDNAKNYRFHKKTSYRGEINELFRHVINVYTHYMRLNTIVEKCAPNLDFWEPNNVRVIWFIQ